MFRGFDHDIINFQELNDFPPRDFEENLQIVSCVATERHPMKNLKFHRL